MKLSDKITYHLSSLILYGSLALFIAFISYVVYVVRFKPCSAKGYQQGILIEVDNVLVSELTKYEIQREQLFIDLLQKKITEQKDFDLSSDSLIEQQILFSETLLFWSQNSNKTGLGSFTEQDKKFDKFYLRQLNEIQPKFVKTSYEPLANDYYKALVNHLKDDKLNYQSSINNIEKGYYSFMFQTKHDIFSKRYFAKLFKINGSTDIRKFIKVTDNNSIYKKIFATKELICEAHIYYPNDNNLSILFTPNADSHGNIKNLQVDYNIAINEISQNKQPIDLQQYSENLIQSYRNYNFNNF